MDGSAFWMQPCPARGVGLVHMHASQCNQGHHENQCCHCYRTPLSVPAEYVMREAGVPPVPPATFAQMPPVDIERRLNGEPDALLRVRVEPKMATGVTSGDPDGPGRGELTKGQRSYLWQIKDWLDSDPLRR